MKNKMKQAYKMNTYYLTCITGFYCNVTCTNQSEPGGKKEKVFETILLRNFKFLSLFFLFNFTCVHFSSSYFIPLFSSFLAILCNLCVLPCLMSDVILR